MITPRPPSSQKQYDDYFSGDPAFKQPPKLSDDPTDEEKAALAEYEVTLKAARETGDWSSLKIDGQTPTRFVLGQIDRNIFRAIQDRAILPPDSPQRIGPVQLFALLFRLALKSVIGFGDLKVERDFDPAWGWVMAQANVVHQLDEVDQRIVGEIGTNILKRIEGGVRPLS